MGSLQHSIYLKRSVIGFEDMLPGVTTKVEKDASRGKSMVVIEHKEDLNPQIIVKDTSRKALATYSVPTGAQVADGVLELMRVLLSRKLPVRHPKHRTLLVVYLALLNYLKHADLRKVMWDKWQN